MRRPRKRRPKTEPGKVQVNSRTYGLHSRAKRGTIKRAELNERMQEASEHTISSNSPARLIHNALKPFREDFKGGLFFQWLQSHFNAQASKKERFNIINILSPQLSRFKDAAKNTNAVPKWWMGQIREDVNKKYSASRMLDIGVQVDIDMPTLTMHISVKHKMVPKFLADRRYLDGIQFTFITLFPDFEDNDITVESVVLPVRQLNDTETYSFTMNIPAVATSYMLFWKAEGTKGGMVIPNEGTKSMALQQVGTLP